MPSGDSAEGKAGQRARNTARSTTIASAGGPKPPKGPNPPLSWYADNLEPRQWDDIKDEVELVGDVECLVVSGSSSAGGMTIQLQVLPAYVHEALDMIQRSSQGVLVARLYQAPWELFKQDTMAWAHLSDDANEMEL